MANKNNQNFLKENAVNLLGWAVIGIVVVGTVAVLVSNQNSAGANSEVSQEILGVSSTDNIRGPEEAVITIVEYSDFQCPFCATVNPVVKQVLAAYPDQVNLVYRHFPLNSIHPNAQEAAVAVQAAKLQNKFWEMNDLLFERQNQWVNDVDPRPRFIEYALELGMDSDQFQADMRSDPVVAKVNSDRAGGINAAVQSTPTFFINGVNVGNPQTLEGFSNHIEAILGAEVE